MKRRALLSAALVVALASCAPSVDTVTAEGPSTPTARPVRFDAPTQLPTPLPMVRESLRCLGPTPGNAVEGVPGGSIYDYAASDLVIPGPPTNAAEDVIRLRYASNDRGAWQRVWRATTGDSEQFAQHHEGTGGYGALVMLFVHERTWSTSEDVDCGAGY